MDAALESTGRRSDAGIFALNSYENRVYQIGMEEGPPLIAKFYRPDRWSDAAILEEHQFTLELEAQEIPILAPMQINDETLFTQGNYRMALYRRQGGHAPALDDFDDLFRLGSAVGRIHAVARRAAFVARPELSVATFAQASRDFLIQSQLLPDDYRLRYEVLSEELITLCTQRFDTIKPAVMRTHGDCHVGNILMREDVAWFVDFDDARNAPAVQDLWMFLSGSLGAWRRQLLELIEGYEQFSEFDLRELRLIEPLRALRFMYHAAWLARRWSDPAFPPAFPWFNTAAYWGEHVTELEEQVRVLQDDSGLTTDLLG